MLVKSKLKTPIGVIYLIADQQILLGAGFNDYDNLISRLSANDLIQEIKTVSQIPLISEAVNKYFDGEISALNSIKVRQPGAAFSQSVWEVMRRIPAGKTLSYAELAKRSGSKGAVRATGTACAKNLLAPIIPCHRIIKSDGALGNYAYGSAKKEWLLRHEGAL